MRDRGDGDDRREHGDDREERDRADLHAQVAKGREERRRVEQRRENADKHQLRRKLRVREAGHKAEREPTEDEQDRIGQPQGRDEREQAGDRREQREQDELLVRAHVHARTIRPRRQVPRGPSLDSA